MNSSAPRFVYFLKNHIYVFVEFPIQILNCFPNFTEIVHLCSLISHSVSLRSLFWIHFQAICKFPWGRRSLTGEPFCSFGSGIFRCFLNVSCITVLISAHLVAQSPLPDSIEWLSQGKTFTSRQAWECWLGKVQWFWLCVNAVVLSLCSSFGCDQCHQWLQVTQWSKLHRFVAMMVAV